jgi:hypothetical protein
MKKPILEFTKFDYPISEDEVKISTEIWNKISFSLTCKLFYDDQNYYNTNIVTELIKSK